MNQTDVEECSTTVTLSKRVAPPSFYNQFSHQSVNPATSWTKEKYQHFRLPPVIQQSAGHPTMTGRRKRIQIHQSGSSSAIIQYSTYSTIVL